MTSTLTLILNAPIQSWGGSSIPTVSGINGLLAASQGIARGENFLPTYDGIALVWRNPKQTINSNDFRSAWDHQENKNSLSYPSLVENGDFAVILTGDPESLTQIHRALLNPTWATYAGQKAAILTPEFVTPHSLVHDTTLDAAIDDAQSGYDSSAVYVDTRGTQFA